MIQAEVKAKLSTAKTLFAIDRAKPIAGDISSSFDVGQVAYRLRVVVMGALTTAAALVNLLVYLLLEGPHRSNDADGRGFMLVLALGVLALASAAAMPWSKILDTKWSVRVLYGWSVYGIALVSLAIYFDGGGSSAMFPVYMVLSVFFAVAYPLRMQLTLFLLTVAMYALAVWLRGWEMDAAQLYIRLATLALVSSVVSVLSAWLTAEMRDRASSSSAAEARAGMLDTVACAARRVSSLDAAQVVGGALSAAIELDCIGAELWLFDGQPKELHLQRRISIDESEISAQEAAELFSHARSTGVTQIAASEKGEGLIACMIFREGEPSGLLAVRGARWLGEDALFVECVELLAAQVSAGLDVARNVAERRGLEERLAHWAFHDALTNLPNRVLFADRLELALARTARDDSMVAVLFLDLDNFKGINDTLGHAAGDELLQAVAHRLHACLRPNDTLARYGGDEFVVLVEQVDSVVTATGVALRILEALSRPIAVHGTELHVKTSIGIALAGQYPGADADVMRRADMAMYKAKTTGGSCYVLSPAPDIADGETERTMEPREPNLAEEA